MKKKKRIRVRVLKAITIIVIVALVLAICLIDSDSEIPAYTAIVCLAWLALIGYANRDMIDGWFDD